MGELPGGTVTLLLTDVEASTERWQRDAGAMREAMAEHDRVLAAAIEANDGARPLEQGEGDSVVAAFARPSAAIAAAVEAQRALQNSGLCVRMAIHTGEAEVIDGTRYAGPAIIRAARLRALARGGQVLLSGATADVIADGVPTGVDLVDLGRHRLKGLDRPERVFQLVHPDLPVDFPSLSSDDRPPTNLPAELTTFVGREVERAEVASALGRARLLTLTGAGGSGKTRLAMSVATATETGFPDGIWWVDLATLAEASLVPQALFAAVGLADVAGRPAVDRVADYLGGGRALVVLDNVEHLVAACAELVTTLLRRCRQLRVLATSREPLGVDGEVVFRVPSLNEQDAVSLFEQRARQVRPNFGVSEDDAKTVADICSRLDGMPLAIELAAARVRAVPPARILAGLDDRFRLLTGGARTSIARQRTLAASVEWSYDLLEPDEQALLRRLSVFSGGFDLEAAEAVCAGEGIDAYAVLDLLSRLVDKSLTVFDDNMDRYRLLETVRQFAADRLTAAGEIAVYRDRHLAYFLALAEAAVRRCDADSRALDVDNDNFRAALEWSLDAEDADFGLRLAAALAPFWLEMTRFAEGRRWLSAALARTEGSPQGRGWAMRGLAQLSTFAGDRSDRPLAEEALAVGQQIGDDGLVARATSTMALDLLYEDVASARELAVESRRVAEETGDLAAQADALGVLLYTFAVRTEEVPDAILAEALDLAQRQHDAHLHIAALAVRGISAHRRGHLAEARATLGEALELARADGHPVFLAGPLVALSEFELFSGDYEAGRALLEEGLELLRHCGAGLWEMNLGTQLGFVLVAEGKTTEARAAIASDLEHCERQHMTWGVQLYRVVLALAAMLEGHFDDAVRTLEDVAAWAAGYGDAWVESLAAHFAGLTCHLGGDLERAESFQHRALSLRCEHGYRPGVAESLEALAAVVSAQESFAEAARLYGAAAAIRDSLGFLHRPGRESLYEMYVSGLRATMGSEPFEEAWAEGARLSLEDAVSYASRARGERRRPSAGWASLTPTELEVVRAVREGLSNPEIGARLFIARSTVKTHLAHIFAKLAVGSRAELAAAAAERRV